MLYSVLDLFRSPPESAELVQRADALGFHRYWVGEHHNPTQCPNPLLLGAVLLGLTERLRVGTGAIGLFARSPLAIAEDVRIIRTLFGDRFDLGISRGFVGTDPGSEARQLLLDGRDEMLLHQAYPERVSRLCALLSDGESGAPGAWLVGSSPETARTAALLGVGFCTSLYHARTVEDLDTALAIYRDTFRPMGSMTEPHAILVHSGVCAPSATEAQAALRAFFLDQDSGAVGTRPLAAWFFVGNSRRCREAIEAVIARFRPDELMLHNLMPQSLDMELAALALLAAEFRLVRAGKPLEAQGR